MRPWWQHILARWEPPHGCGCGLEGAGLHPWCPWGEVCRESCFSVPSLLPPGLFLRPCPTKPPPCGWRMEQPIPLCTPKLWLQEVGGSSQAAGGCPGGPRDMSMVGWGWPPRSGEPLHPRASRDRGLLLRGPLGHQGTILLLPQPIRALQGCTCSGLPQPVTAHHPSFSGTSQPI